MKPEDMRKGDRVRVGDDFGTLVARQNKTGGKGLCVLFDGSEDGVDCICEPEDVVFVSRPEQKPSLATQLRAAQAEVGRLTSRLENALDASKEGSWMARALDAELEVARLTAENSTSCEALATALGIETDHTQRRNLCWLVGRLTAEVAELNGEIHLAYINDYPKPAVQLLREYREHVDFLEMCQGEETTAAKVARLTAENELTFKRLSAAMHALRRRSYNQRIELKNLNKAYSRLTAENEALRAAARSVVAADTYVTPGKSRFEATSEAIARLETLLPMPQACAAVEFLKKESGK